MSSIHPIGYGTPDPSTPSPSPEIQESESFPITSVEIVAGVSVAIFSVSLLIYLKKRNH